MERPVAGPPAWYDFEGRRYYRRRDGYYSSGTHNEEGRSKRFHIAIWESANGQALPPGLVVHHIDHDHENNDPANLTAITQVEHMAHHHGGAKRTQQTRDLISQRVAESWKRRAPTRYTCVLCGVEFERVGTRNSKFCSRLCEKRMRHGWHPELRGCDRCGAHYMPTDRKHRFCSGSCRDADLSDRRKARRRERRLRPDG